MNSTPRPAATGGSAPARPRRRAVGARAALVLALGLGTTLPALGEWPQWRGPEGLGVAADGLPLPAEWGPASPNVRWRTALPGEATSSPIASGGRVFVTTAYEGRRKGGGAGWIPVAVVALALGTALAARGRAPRPLVAFTVFFALLAVAITLWPDPFYFAGSPGRTWRNCGAVALIGLAAACGWLRPASRWRLLGIVALVGAVGFVAWLMPHGKVGPQPWGKRLLFVLPALVAAWIYARGHLRARAAQSGEAGDRRSPLVALPLVLLALLVFVPPNYGSGLQRKKRVFKQALPGNKNIPAGF